MKFKRPYIATLDEVTITKNGESAIIKYKEPGIFDTNLKIGLKIQKMTKQEILDYHNNFIRAQLEFMKNYKHVAIEVPPNQPQIKYFEPGCYWTARGSVLRCLINDNAEGETIIQIDDREFNMREFGKLLSVFTGWGMRIIIVPEDEVCEHPKVEIKDPTQKESGSISISKEFISNKEH